MTARPVRTAPETNGPRHSGPLALRPIGIRVHPWGIAVRTTRGGWLVNIVSLNAPRLVGDLMALEPIVVRADADS